MTTVERPSPAPAGPPPRAPRRRRGGLVAAAVVVVLVIVAGIALGSSAGDDAGDRATASTPPRAGDGTAAPRTEPTAQDVALAKAAGNRFLDGFVASSGRVIRRDQGGDTVSEGQAYGLLVAVALGDRDRFASIWGWTREHLQRDDALLSFQWQDGKVVDPLPATDADLDTARALLLAATRFDEPVYRTEALAIGNSILLRETIDVSKRKFLVAGPWARATPAVVNPSYFSPRAYDALYAATGDRRWQQLQDTSLETIDGLTQISPSLPPDWARVHGTQIVPSIKPDDAVKGVRYGYEAARVFPRYAEMCPATSKDPDAIAPSIGRRLVARAWPWFQTQGAEGPTAEYRPDGRRIGGNKHALASVAAASAADAAGDTAARDRLLEIGQSTQDLATNYYGAAWMALGRIMLTTNLLGSCGSSTPVA